MPRRREVTVASVRPAAGTDLLALLLAFATADLPVVVLAGIGIWGILRFIEIRLQPSRSQEAFVAGESWVVLRLSSNQAGSWSKTLSLRCILLGLLQLLSLQNFFEKSEKNLRKSKKSEKN